MVVPDFGPERRSGARTAASYGTEPLEETLARTRFGRPRVSHASGRADLIRDADGVIAGYLSMSFAAPPLFGARVDDFLADLRTFLQQRSSSGRFWDCPGDTRIRIARRGWRTQPCAGVSSASNPSMRRLISSRIGRTASIRWPAGSSRSQSS